MKAKERYLNRTPSTHGVVVVVVVVVFLSSPSIRNKVYSTLCKTFRQVGLSERTIAVCIRKCPLHSQRHFILQIQKSHLRIVPSPFQKNGNIF